jgi:hypothetical protein
MTRQFPAPWRVVETPGGWKVEDATGFAVAYVYGHDGPRGAGNNRMSKGQARRIALGIARLGAAITGEP